MAANRTPLRALIVDDSADDADLLLLELQRAGYAVEWRRVDNADDTLAALNERDWDVILSDYQMPGFSGLRALEIVQGSGKELPFIIISGTIGEETAVEALKAGAHDFLVKGKLARLQPAIDRELREAQIRRSHHRAQAALRDSENRYRHIVEAAQEGIWVIDADLRTLYLNQRMAEMLSASPEQLQQTDLLGFLDPESSTLVRSIVSATDGRPRQLKFTRRDGTELWTSLAVTPEFQDDEFAGCLLMVTDITDQRSLQVQLMVSDRMASVGLLAAGVAHEINNPLAAVLANVELATSRLGELARAPGASPALTELHDGLADAYDAARRVRQIVSDLRIFSRAEREITAPVELGPILESTLRMATNEIRHRATLAKEFGPARPVEANESRLGQVFLNLLVNAAQAISPGHAAENEIRVRLGDRPDGRVEVSVSDTGAGMSPEILKRLFTPFFTTKPPGVGTGLGLSICHKIITGLGGSIEVDSQVGRGTTFRVLLPAAAGVPLRAAPAPIAPAPATRRGKILVVDDEPTIGTIVRRILAAEHEVTVLLRAREAADQILAGARFDVIFCDLMMPEMTGMDLYQLLTQAVPDQARAMIFLTGGAFTASAQSFFEEMKHRRLDKPFAVEDVQAVVREMLGKSPADAAPSTAK